VQRNIIWLDWGAHRRSRSLSLRLGIALIELPFGGIRLARYWRSTRATVRVLRSIRPAVVVATTPSVVLAVLLLLFRPSYRFRLVVDAHFAGVKALARGSQSLLDAINRRVDLAIVTNPGHAAYLRSLRCPTFVCPDPLPDVDATVLSASDVPPKSAFLICSFDRDEPYPAVFAAFRVLQNEGFSLFVSGDYRRAGIDQSDYPWVRFLGFLPDPEYQQYLRSCDVVVDLTRLDDCLVCGAYEALAARRPLVLSNTPALRDYFNGAAVYADNTPSSILEAVQRAWSDRDYLRGRAGKWACENEVTMAATVVRLGSRLSSL
jgi:glycosyltransferase involved in cell wall biosynthesis